MSLRARLVATLLALCAAALLVLAAITYASQRSFENDRVDDQARAAAPAVEHALAEKNGIQPYGPRDGDGDRGPGPEENLPPGTYGVWRDASGRRVGSAVSLSYGETPLSAPKLPADLAPGDVLTVGAKSGDLHYRVGVSPRHFAGGVTIVAIPLNGVEDRLHRLL